MTSSSLQSMVRTFEIAPLNITLKYFTMFIFTEIALKLASWFCYKVLELVALSAAHEQATFRLFSQSNTTVL